MISRIEIRNFKRFRNIGISLRKDLNILCGDNDTGKSTILEALDMALSGRYRGKPVEGNISPAWFNREVVGEFLSACADGARPAPPEILISLETDDAQGSFQSHLRIFPKAEYLTLLYEFASGRDAGYLPGEYYGVERLIPEGATLPEVVYVDGRQNTPGHDSLIPSLFGKRISPDNLMLFSRLSTEMERCIGADDAVSELDALLNDSETAMPTGSRLSIGASPPVPGFWNRLLDLKIDGTPLDEAGSGARRSLFSLLSIKSQTTPTSRPKLLLLEQPEKDLSFTSTSRFTDWLRESLAGCQTVITTLSSLVTNRLGLDAVILFSRKGCASLSRLSSDTRDFFHRLSGYDTLRLILAKKTILVEGPSDELIVQKAWIQRFGHLPETDGVDVMGVGGISFRHYLEIASPLGLRVAVAADSDGDPERLRRRLGIFSDSGEQCVFTPSTVLCAADFTGNIPSSGFNFNTLEPNLLRCNGLERMNRLLSTTFANETDLLVYMWRNKVESALRIFRSADTITIPRYIDEAIDFIMR